MTQTNALKKLSDFMNTARNPSVYAREFMRAAEEGKFVGVILTAEKVPLKQSKKGGKTRNVPEFVILDSPEFEAWNRKFFESENHAKGLPTVDDLLTGAADLEKAQARTLEFLRKRRKRNEQTTESIRRKKTQQTT